MAVLGLRFSARAFSSCGKWAPLFIMVRGPLTIAASLVAEHRLQTHRLSSCGSRAQLLRGMWDLPRPGLEPMSPALAVRFSTTEPPGKPHSVIFKCYMHWKEFFKCQKLNKYEINKNNLKFNYRLIFFIYIRGAHSRNFSMNIIRDKYEWTSWL